MKRFDFYVDQKVTNWMRTSFGVEAETLEAAKSQAILMCKNGEVDDLPWEEIDDLFPEVMDIKDNGGASTMEVYYDAPYAGINIFQNGE